MYVYLFIYVFITLYLSLTSFSTLKRKTKNIVFHSKLKKEKNVFRFETKHGKRQLLKRPF